MKSRKKKSPSSKKSCPNCGKKIFDIAGHQKRNNKCNIFKKKSASPSSHHSSSSSWPSLSPVKSSVSRKTKSPVSRLLRKTKSPVKSPVSRKKTCPICNKQVLNLKQHQKSKTCMRIAGLSHKSPIRKTKSPIRKTKSLIRKTKSPMKSPIRKTKSPVSRKKTCQICNKQVLNLRQHQKSAKCRRVALTIVKSPLRKAKSPVRKIKSPQRYGNIFNNVRPRLAQQNLDDFIIPYDESKCQDDCPICLTENDESDSIILRDCRHCFHLECLRQWWNHSSKCPSCNRIYGFQVGNMPMGTMSAILERPMLSGSRYNTIIITYNFPAGVTTANQPNPGTPYPSDVRNCYLEASPEGYEVLDLLRRSFERGLTFTIGDSLTTGRRNVVVWNGVHHKTNTNGGPAGFGFPDPGYYGRVKDELRAKGIF